MELKLPHLLPNKMPLFIIFSKRYFKGYKIAFSKLKFRFIRRPPSSTLNVMVQLHFWFVSVTTCIFLIILKYVSVFEQSK